MAVFDWKVESVMAAVGYVHLALVEVSWMLLEEYPATMEQRVSVHVHLVLVVVWFDYGLREEPKEI